MPPNELAELLRRGEDSMIEFKRDDVQNYDWAKELAVFLNLAGGIVLLGVDDSGAIVGSTRDADRLEVTIPGKLPNTVTPQGMRCGMRAHNGTAPELIAEEHRFIVRLLKAPKEKR